MNKSFFCYFIQQIVSREKIHQQQMATSVDKHMFYDSVKELNKLSILTLNGTFYGIWKQLEYDTAIFLRTQPQYAKTVIHYMNYICHTTTNHHLKDLALIVFKVLLIKIRFSGG